MMLLMMATMFVFDALFQFECFPEDQLFLILQMISCLSHFIQDNVTILVGFNASKIGLELYLDKTAVSRFGN